MKYASISIEASTTVDQEIVMLKYFMWKNFVVLLS